MKKLLLLIIILTLGVGCGNINRIQQSGFEVSHFDSLTIIPTNQWRCYAQKSGIDVRNLASRNPVTVLGHYPEYVELAAEIKAESMQIPMEEWDAMTPEEQWSATTGFFDKKIAANHNFRLATPLERARPGSYYIRELKYLFGKGYMLSPDGLWLVR